MTTIALHNQSMVDMAIQGHGRLEAVIDWAMENQMSLTDPLESGLELKEPGTEKEAIIIGGYQAQEVYPATDITDADLAVIENNDPCNLCKCFT